MSDGHAGHAEVADPPVAAICRSRRIAWIHGLAHRLWWPDGRASVTGRYASLVVMLVVGVAVSAAACGSGGAGSDAVQPPTSTVRQLEAVPAPDPSTPDGVAVAALKEIYTWYPATEAQGASLSRAQKWLGPSLIRTLNAPTGTEQVPNPSLQWAEWGKAGVKVEAFAFASGEQAPASGDPDHQQYKIGIEQTAVYPGGRRDALPPTTVIATAVRTAGGWRLDGFR